ncbi:MAG TPA: MarR family transcriptional regulator [Galbitalea sp.]|jgi:DNA-binding MarR family transcriptional regulator|nr:MarR family transcriptional regulator [Galbitalea sp.]
MSLDDEYADRNTVATTLTASRALLGVVARSVSKALESVSMPQFRVLIVLASSGPMRMGLLAERMNAVPSTFSRSIDRLVSGGWVERIESPESRREVIIRLTSLGRALVDDVTERRRQEIAAILSRMSSDERAALQGALVSFAEAAGEPTAEELLVLGL